MIIILFQKKNIRMLNRFYPWDISTPCNTWPKIWLSSYYCLWSSCVCLWKQCRSWSDAECCGVWSGSTLFTQASALVLIRQLISGLIKYSSGQEIDMILQWTSIYLIILAIEFIYYGGIFQVHRTGRGLCTCANTEVPAQPVRFSSRSHQVVETKRPDQTAWKYRLVRALMVAYARKQSTCIWTSCHCWLCHDTAFYMLF